MGWGGEEDMMGRRRGKHVVYGQNQLMAKLVIFM